MSNKILVLYTMNGCPFCETLKEQLNENSISFHELDIDENKEEYQLFTEITENEYVPAFIIIKVDGVSRPKLFAPERDYNLISEAVEIIKKELLAN